MVRMNKAVSFPFTDEAVTCKWSPFFASSSNPSMAPYGVSATVFGSRWKDSSTPEVVFERQYTLTTSNLTTVPLLSSNGPVPRSCNATAVSVSPFPK